jgi:stage III sporulation protein AD
MWFKLCGGALLCAVAILLIKNGGGVVLPLQWTGTLLLVGASLMMLAPVFVWIEDLCVQNGMGEVATLLLKGLGVAILTQLCAEMCRQSGEGALGSGVEMAGKAELMLLCLPYLQRLVDTAKELLEAVP